MEEKELLMNEQEITELDIELMEEAEAPSMGGICGIGCAGVICGFGCL